MSEIKNQATERRIDELTSGGHFSWAQRLAQDAADSPYIHRKEATLPFQEAHYRHLDPQDKYEHLVGAQLYYKGTYENWLQRAKQFYEQRIDAFDLMTAMEGVYSDLTEHLGRYVEKINVLARTPEAEETTQLVGQITETTILATMARQFSVDLQAVGESGNIRPIYLPYPATLAEDRGGKFAIDAFFIDISTDTATETRAQFKTNLRAGDFDRYDSTILLIGLNELQDSPHNIINATNIASHPLVSGIINETKGGYIPKTEEGFIDSCGEIIKQKIKHHGIQKAA